MRNLFADRADATDFYNKQRSALMRDTPHGTVVFVPASASMGDSTGLVVKPR